MLLSFILDTWTDIDRCSIPSKLINCALPNQPSMKACLEQLRGLNFEGVIRCLDPDLLMPHVDSLSVVAGDAETTIAPITGPTTDGGGGGDVQRESSDGRQSVEPHWRHKCNKHTFDRRIPSPANRKACADCKCKLIICYRCCLRSYFNRCTLHV